MTLALLSDPFGLGRYNCVIIYLEVSITLWSSVGTQLKTLCHSLNPSVANSLSVRVGLYFLSLPVLMYLFLAKRVQQTSVATMSS